MIPRVLRIPNPLFSAPPVPHTNKILYPALPTCCARTLQQLHEDDPQGLEDPHFH